MSNRVEKEKHKAEEIQVSLARLGAEFGSALADIFQTEFLRILAERLSQWEIGPPLRRACHYPPLKKWGSLTLR